MIYKIIDIVRALNGQLASLDESIETHLRLHIFSVCYHNLKTLSYESFRNTGKVIPSTFNKY